MIAQQMAFEQPEMIRRMILCGTGPRGGEGMTFTELSIDELEDPVALILKSFFTPSEPGQSAGNAYLGRLSLRETERVSPVTLTSADAQLRAIREWGTIPAEKPVCDARGHHSTGVDRSRQQGHRRRPSQRLDP
jgi:pimeloyl-ACP methyl ester carboxylesterase